MARRGKQLTLPKVIACTVLGLTAGAFSCGPDDEDDHHHGFITCVRDSTDAGTVGDAGTCPSNVEREEDCPAGCEPIVV